MLLRTREPRTPFRLTVIRNCERVRPQQNRMRQRRIKGPPAIFEREPESVKSATDIQALAVANQMTRTKFYFLAADAKAQVLRGVSDIEKRLVQIGDVLICQAWTSIASLFKTTLKLREESKVSSKMPVSMEKIALQDIPGGRLGIRAEAWILVVLVFVSYFTANREIPFRSAERNVLNMIDQFFVAILIP